jgi:hypothetical protein
VRVRTLLVGTALLSAALGAVVVYLVMTVPNDVQASALMKKAKQQIADGDHDNARASLSRIVQQYPRTDAAAAATVALSTLADNERRKLTTEIEALKRQQDALQKQIATQGERVQTIENRPPPAPVVIHEPAPKPAPQVAPKPAAKKKATPSKKRRR